MTADVQSNNVEQTQPSDKELNFRKLEERYERQLSHERSERERLTRELEQRQKQPVQEEEEERDDEPYVDHKKLTKKLNKFGQVQQSEIQKAMDQAKRSAKEELRQELWLENNSDFYDVLKHADKFAQEAPELADTILRMPDTFDRQKLVYQNIKKLGVHKPPEAKSTIQQKVDANRQNQYYQPSGVGSAPYAPSSDFSPAGQKQAYDKMQALKAKFGS